MDRRDRRYDDRDDPEVTRMGAGESYRPLPRNRSPIRDRDRDRSRSPIRRDRARTPPRMRPRSPPRERARSPYGNDRYGNRDRSPRRRSRTPPYRGRDRTPPRDVPNWRDRARSPPRARTPPRARSPMRARSPTPRRFSPRRDDDRRERARTPRRDSPPRRDERLVDPRSSGYAGLTPAFRRRSRSPYGSERRRSRSPYDRAPPRARSPALRRSPPLGPRGAAAWRARSRTPPRGPGRVTSGPTSLTWRRRSPSPPAPRPEQTSARTSGNTSRRSSPPVHPSRLAAMPVLEAENKDGPSPYSRDRSPPPLTSTTVLESARSTPRERSPARPQPNQNSPRPRSPPRGPAGFKVPTGPSATRNFTAPIKSESSIPAGPSGMSAAAAFGNFNDSPAPPAGPRGYNAPLRGMSRGGRSSFNDRRPEPSTSSWGAAPAPRPAPVASPTISPTTPSSNGIPTGPRATTTPQGPAFWAAPSRTSSISTPRSQRFDAASSGPRTHPAIANLPPIIPGGKRDLAYSGLPSELEARMKKTEEEVERQRDDLRIRQEKLRRGLKKWDNLERESAAMALRSELSEKQVRTLSGETFGGAAF